MATVVNMITKVMTVDVDTCAQQVTLFDADFFKVHRLAPVCLVPNAPDASEAFPLERYMLLHHFVLELDEVVHRA